MVVGVDCSWAQPYVGCPAAKSNVHIFTPPIAGEATCIGVAPRSHRFVLISAKSEGAIDDLVLLALSGGDVVPARVRDCPAASSTDEQRRAELDLRNTGRAAGVSMWAIPSAT
jgi:hypothetical protein